MMETNQDNLQKDGGFTIAEVFVAIKKHIVVILSIIIAACVIGFIFAKVRTVNYIASENLVYNIEKKYEDGTTRSDTTSVNVSRSYFDTLLDFCKTGKVYDRANYYFSEYKKANIQNLDAFIEQCKAEDFEYDTEKITVTPLNDGAVSAKKIDDDDKINFKVTVKNTSIHDAKVLTRLLVLSVQREFNNAISENKYVEGSGASEKIYTYNINIQENISGDGVSGIAVSKDMSTVKILLISGIIGVLLALIVVYILQITYNKLTSEKELNKITNAPLLANIEDWVE